MIVQQNPAPSVDVAVLTLLCHVWHVTTEIAIAACIARAGGRAAPRPWAKMSVTYQEDVRDRCMRLLAETEEPTTDADVEVMVAWRDQMAKLAS